MKSESEVAQSCPTLCNLMDCSLPGSSIHGIFQASILEWAAIAYSKESWVTKNWCFWTVVLKKTLESPLDCRKIKLVNPKGNQSWILIGRTDAKAEAPIHWPPDAKNWLLRKDHDAGKDWRQEEKGTTEDEIVWWYHWLDGHEFEQAQEYDGKGGLECCSPRGSKESDTTMWLNWRSWWRGIPGWHLTVSRPGEQLAHPEAGQKTPREVSLRRIH